MFKEKQMIKKRERIWQFAYFLLPALFIYAVFIIYPIFSTAYYSFYDWTGLNDVKTFIGMENYRTMLADEAFRHSIVNNIWVVIVSVFIQIPLGLAMALLVRRKSRGNNILRILYFLPFLMSTAKIRVLLGQIRSQKLSDDVADALEGVLLAVGHAPARLAYAVLVEQRLEVFAVSVVDNPRHVFRIGAHHVGKHVEVEV